MIATLISVGLSVGGGVVFRFVLSLCASGQREY